MSDVTQILQQVECDDPAAVRELFTVVYDELRKLAAQQLQGERPGQTLQATALVHEAWLKLMSPNSDQLSTETPSGTDASEVSGKGWKSRSHFFGAAAEAMRRILVDNARRRNRLKRGGNRKREQLNLDVVADIPDDDLLESLDEALEKFRDVDATACELVQLRYFVGLSLAEASEILQISPRSADRLWSYAKAWLLREIRS